MTKHYKKHARDIQITNPWKKPFGIGLSARKKFRDDDTFTDETFYGILTSGLEFSLKTIRTIDARHFHDVTECELDIYLNLNEKNGVMRIKRVGYLKRDKYESEIWNLNNSGNDAGWIPHFIFNGINSSNQEITFAKMDPSLYGRNMSEIDGVCNNQDFLQMTALDDVSSTGTSNLELILLGIGVIWAFIVTK